MILDENQLKEFHENGFLLLKNFANSELCDEILAKAKSHLEQKLLQLKLNKNICKKR